MATSDSGNSGIVLIAIIVGALLAIVGLWLAFGQGPATRTASTNGPSVHVQVPQPSVSVTTQTPARPAEPAQPPPSGGP